MKYFIFVTAALLAVSGLGWSASVHYDEAPVDVRGLLEDTINATFNRLLANLSDSITIDDIPFDAGDDSPYISGGFDLSNVRINGIKSLVATDISLSILSLTIKLNVKLTEILVSLKYIADLTLLQLIPLYGDGRMNIVLDDVELAITGKASLSGGISLHDLTVILSLGESTFDLNGLINNPEFSALVSNALNDNFADFINDNSDVISSLISPIVETVINEILKS